MERGRLLTELWQFGYTAMRLSSGVGRLQRTASSGTWKVLYISCLKELERGKVLQDKSVHEE